MLLDSHPSRKENWSLILAFCVDFFREVSRLNLRSRLSLRVFVHEKSKPLASTPMPALAPVDNPGYRSEKPPVVVVVVVVVADVVGETNVVAGAEFRSVDFQRSSTPYVFQPPIPADLCSEALFVIPSMFVYMRV